MSEPGNDDRFSPASVVDIASKPYRELTVAALVLGLIQGIPLNLAFCYVALKLGFGLGGSTVAAILGYAMLRGVLRTGSMVENNINQTIASGINTAGSGIVFTVPALYLLNPDGVNFLPLAIAGIAGAVLGVVLIIPLRKQMIEMDRLRFPSGVATATIIRAGASGVEKAQLLAMGVLVSVVWKCVLISGGFSTPRLIEDYGFGLGGRGGDELHFGFNIIPDYTAPIVSLSLMNMAAGMLAGRGGLPFFFGGVLSWWVISPVAVGRGWMPPDAEPESYVGVLYSQMLRPLGIGMLIGGALMGVVMAFPAIKSALRSLATAAKSAAAGGVVGADELKLKPLVGGLILGMTLLFTASMLTPDITVGDAVLSMIVGTLWAGLAALIVAQASGMTDIQPMSGMSLISVTLMLILLSGNAAGAMVVGVAVCVAIGQGADMMQDLKTGFMIGARPIRQQIMQFAVTWIGALVALLAVHVLWNSPAADPGGPGTPASESVADSNTDDSPGTTTGGGFGPNSKLPAPQGVALSEIIRSLSSKDGLDSVPIDKYAMGASVGALLGAAPMAGLGVLVGLAMYLPFYITLGYGIGCLLQMAIQRARGVGFCEHKLVPFAAGLIVGEALVGMGNAFYAALN